MNLKKIFISLLLTIFIGTHAQEKILKFDSKIHIEKSGVIQVIENITIKAEGDKFQRGLLRILPLLRKDKDGNSIDVEYQINSIKKNGNVEKYFTRNDAGEWKIYIGEETVFLEPGIYDYQISYSAPYQVGYFENYDEIYWNVTGNGWNFPIDKVSCQIMLPGENNKFENVFCYTGLSGSKASDCISSLNENKMIASFHGSNLKNYEGLTVATSFAKGIVDPPTTSQQSFAFYKQIKVYLWSIVYGFGMLIFFFFSWKKNGKDPSKQTIIPEYRPPFGWSPAIIGYVYNREANDKSYMASLINIAVKGAMKISSTVSKGIFTNNIKYEIEVKNRTIPNLSLEEAASFKHLSKTDKTIMNSTNYKIFEKSNNFWFTSVVSQIKLTDFYQNNTKKKWIGFGVFILFTSLFIILSSNNNSSDFFTFLILVGLNALLVCWYAYTDKYLILKVLLVCLTLPLTFFIIIAKTISLNERQDVIIPLIVAIIFIACIVYVLTIGKYTIKGVEAIAKIEGFKLYLETAEKDRMNMLNPPELTPQLFEELFPYAIALGVEIIWGKQFERVLEMAKYNPEWCQGDDQFYRKPTLFLSSFSDSVKESKIDPTERSSSSSNGGSSGSSGSWSSGSSGGGSSGGGGGGGGGGGW